MGEEARVVSRRHHLFDHQTPLLVSQTPYAACANKKVERGLQLAAEFSKPRVPTHIEL